MNAIEGPEHRRAEHVHDADEPAPRAFAQGTGILLQTVGGILFLSSCCVCSSSFLWDPQWSLIQAQRFLEDQEHGQQQGDGASWFPSQRLGGPAKFGLMLMVMFTTVGGLAMAVFGLGLQAEKPASGWAALVTNGVFLLVLIVAGAALWSGQASPAVRVWHGIVSMVVIVLLGFTITALRQMIAHPPPGDLQVVPADYDPRDDLAEG